MATTSLLKKCFSVKSNKSWLTSFYLLRIYSNPIELPAVPSCQILNDRSTTTAISCNSRLILPAIAKY